MVSEKELKKTNDISVTFGLLCEELADHCNNSKYDSTLNLKRMNLCEIVIPDDVASRVKRNRQVKSETDECKFMCVKSESKSDVSDCVLENICMDNVGINSVLDVSDDYSNVTDSSYSELDDSSERYSLSSPVKLKTKARGLIELKTSKMNRAIPNVSTCNSTNIVDPLIPSCATIVSNSRNPADVVRVKHIKGLPLTENDIRILLKDRQKKDNHNMIERRRRFNINDRIKELGNLLPQCKEMDGKLNKGSILKASVEYIKQLKVESERLKYLQERCEIISAINQELLKKLQEFENLSRKFNPPNAALSSRTQNGHKDGILDIVHSLIKSDPEIDDSSNALCILRNDDGTFAFEDSLNDSINCNCTSESSSDLVHLENDDFSRIVDFLANEPVSPMINSSNDPILGNYDNFILDEKKTDNFS